ncbi:MAG: 3,4-dehydroadipyl-CoA semialdehyde dehydrogenase [Planctomycetota bacterium]|nr:MAG: 3,4-dehydroadipyl-CoA semialdehyde dehydrogenase [Planctomycetota bacterium]
MTILQSYLAGRWQTGTGPGTPLVNPTSDELLAHASSVGLDLGEALRHGRQVGGPALRAMSFAERGAALKALSAAIHEQREALIALGVANAGNTRGDAKFDIDGATATLAAYAHFAKSLPDTPFLPDGDAIQLGRAPRFLGQHVWVPRRGVALHVNAFNFPAWGMAEKAACAPLAGVPVLEKPGTPTAMMAEAIAHIVVDSGILPEGAFQFLCGGAGDLLDHVETQDCVAFTGSSTTAAIFRRHDAFVLRGARLNVEADSLNAAVLGPGVCSDDEVFDLFVREVVREVTQKAGQKCTAIRRVMVPEAMLGEACEAIAAGLEGVRVGDPAQRDSRMGPLTNAAQLASVLEGTERLASVGEAVTGGDGRRGDVGCFVSPTLLRASDADADVLHADEVFGPITSVMPYDGTVARAAELVVRGQGGLVASLYCDDRRFSAELAQELMPWTGRVYAGDSKTAEYATGHGLVLPACTHGGPGRAGGGEELGGLRGLQFSMQRCALQGGRALVDGFSSKG